MKRLVLEATAPFQGLPELVAYDEGLFAAEGLDVHWGDETPVADKTIRTDLTSPDGLDPFASHGALFEQGAADMYNACEWGNYCRVQETTQRGRQIGRRSVIAFAGIVVRPDSDVYTPQQLAGRTVAVPFYFGTHYLALHMLEGFLTRDQINVCRAPSGSRNRFDAMMAGDIEATTLTEPYLTLAEKQGCRIVCSAFFHGTEVASDRVDSETYAAFNRAVREAVRRINLDKTKYLAWFIEYHKKNDPEIGVLTVDDLCPSRLVVVDPAPIPDDEARRTAEWLKGWDMLTTTDEATDLINKDVQTGAHAAA